MRWNALLLALPGILFCSDIPRPVIRVAQWDLLIMTPVHFLWMFHHPLLSLQPALSAQLAEKLGLRTSAAAAFYSRSVVFF
ncbi:MAG: hypothetical protein CM1200mP30_15580 [Pseudomonadota bacterium]|nr:MAG: hypothetical protein CM1200mP30_15580 [Pseudomonadota bacterium]